MKPSEYIQTITAELQSVFTGWPIWSRVDGCPKSAEDAWSVEIAIHNIDIPEASKSNPRATIECTANIKYRSKAVTHSQLLQAYDIQMAFVAYLMGKTPPAVFNSGEQISEAIVNVRPARYEAIAVPGNYDMEVQWQDTIQISPTLEIEGYTVAEVDPPFLGISGEGFELQGIDINVEEVV